VGGAERAANSLKPGVQRAIVELNTVIGLRFKFIRIEVLHDSALPSCPDRLLSSRSASVNLYMDDVVTLRSQLGVVVDTAVENNISWLHLFFFQGNWESVELVSLVPTVKVESKILSHIIGNLAK
jgi:hypothetical protein